MRSALHPKTTDRRQAPAPPDGAPSAAPAARGGEGGPLRVCLVHNAYGAFSGEEAAVKGVRRMLEADGHEVVMVWRHSGEIARMRLGRARAFFRGIYSPSARREMARLLGDARPDVVHIHNLYPLLSPSILPACRQAGVPVVMTVHNYRLVCPNGLHMVRGRTCEKCAGGREHWCVLRNCESDVLKSLGYAVRGFVARRLRLYQDNVMVYTVLTEFQRQRLMVAGFPRERIEVVPNSVSGVAEVSEAPLGQYVGYAGRLSREKGLPCLLAAARRCPDVEFALAGDVAGMPDLGRSIPGNVALRGFLSGDALEDFYRRCRFAVLASTCFEGFPGMIAEAMVHGKPVVCSRIGGLPEIVEDGRTGLLFEPGDAEDLARKVRYLWDRPTVCRAMGRAGREKALREYTPERQRERLIGVYRKAMALSRGRPEGQG